MCLICACIVMQIKVNFHTGVWNDWHDDLLWNWDKRRLKTGLCCLLCRFLWFVDLPLSVCLASFYTPQGKPIREFFVGIKVFLLQSFFRVGEVACCTKLHANLEIIALCEGELSQAFTIQEDLHFFLEPSSLNNTLVLKQISPGLFNDQKWMIETALCLL